jgi:hypothetical protein
LKGAERLGRLLVTPRNLTPPTPATQCGFGRGISLCVRAHAISAG